MVYHQKDSLSQNFIKYRGLVSELISASGLNKDDLVIEIGPGKGIITTALAKVVNRVVAIEKDVNLFNDFREKYHLQNVELINEDILRFELPTEKYKIFANIPFSITSEILNKVLQSKNLPESMHLIMQKETANKFSGIPTESLSSVLTKPYFEVEVLGEIDRTNFTLKPQVRIYFVRFVKRESPFVKPEDKKLFFDFITYGFTQWQPTVMEAFNKIMTYDQIKNFKKMLKIGDVKPSELSFDKWLLLFKSWKKIANKTQVSLLSSTKK